MDPTENMATIGSRFRTWLDDLPPFPIGFEVKEGPGAPAPTLQVLLDAASVLGDTPLDHERTWTEVVARFADGSEQRVRYVGVAWQPLLAELAAGPYPPVRVVRLANTPLVLEPGGWALAAMTPAEPGPDVPVLVVQGSRARAVIVLGLVLGISALGSLMMGPGAIFLPPAMLLLLPALRTMLRPLLWPTEERISVDIDEQRLRIVRAATGSPTLETTILRSDVVAVLPNDTLLTRTGSTHPPVHAVLDTKSGPPQFRAVADLVRRRWAGP